MEKRIVIEGGVKYLVFTCPACGREIKDYASSRNYGKSKTYFCSMACRYSNVEYIEFDCTGCGKHIRDLASVRLSKNPKNHFCSVSCRAQYYSSGLTKSERDAIYYENNVKKIRKRVNNYYENNRSDIVERRRLKTRKLKQEVMTAYGGQCVCCGEDILEFLTIDHVNNDGGEHRKRVGKRGVYKDLKKRGYPQDGFRVLCFNCNTSLGYYGYCPHNPGYRNMPSKTQKGDKVGRPRTVKAPTPGQLGAMKEGDPPETADDAREAAP